MGVSIPLAAALNQRLHSAIAAVCPIDGVAIVDAKTQTAELGFLKSATPQEISAAEAALAGFDWSDAATAEFLAAQAKDAASKAIDAGDTKGGTATDLTTKSLMLVLVDQLNELRVLGGLKPLTADEIAAAVKQKIAEANKAAAANVDVGAIDAVPAIGG